MSNEKSSLGLTISIILTITGAVWSIGRIYPMLSKGSAVSQIEFYAIVGIIALILYFGVELYKMRREFTTEKSFIRKEIKSIKDHIDKTEAKFESIKNDITQTLKRIETANDKHHERTDKRIDKILLTPGKS